MLFEEKAQDFVSEDCILEYEENFLTTELSEKLFYHIKETLTFRSESIFIYGKIQKQPRLTAWIGNGLSAYSKYSEPLEADQWDDITLKLLKMVEKKAKRKFNSVLVNWYRDGNDSMGAHSDDESMLGDQPVIVSISLGEQRRFYLKDKASKKTVWKKDLKNGSYLLMGGNLQAKYVHGINKSKKQLGERINLTFRYLRL